MTNSIRRVACLAASLICAPTLAAPTVNFFGGGGTPFSAAAHTTGAAPSIVGGGPSGSFLRLTDLTTSARNTIWFDQTESGAATSIRAAFDFRSYGGNRGDGLAFGLASTNHFGSTGAENPIDGEDIFDEKGYLEESIAIAFDTYQNINHGDPDDNSVSVHFDEQLVGTFDPGFALYRASDDRFHHAVLMVDFVPAGAELTLELTEAGGTPSTIFDSFLIPGVAAYESRVAFGARNGASSSYQDINNLVVGYPNVPEPTALTLASLAFLAIGRRQRPSGRQ